MSSQNTFKRWPDLSAYKCKLNVYVESPTNKVMAFSGEITNEIREKIERIGFVRLPAGLYALAKMTPAFQSDIVREFPEMRMRLPGDVCADGTIITYDDVVRDLTKPEVLRIYGNPVKNITPDQIAEQMQVVSEGGEDEAESVDDPDDLITQVVTPDHPASSVMLPVFFEKNQIGEIDLRSLTPLENYVKDVTLLQGDDGTRYIRKTVALENGEDGDILQREDAHMASGWYLRPQSDADLKSMCFRLVREMEARPISGDEFRKWVRAVSSLSVDAEIPDETMKKLFGFVALEVSRSVIRNSEARMRDRFDTMCRLVQHMPRISHEGNRHVPHQVSFAMSRALMLETQPAFVTGLCLNDAYGLALATLNNSENTEVYVGIPDDLPLPVQEALEVNLTSSATRMHVSSGAAFVDQARFQYLDLTRERTSEYVDMDVDGEIVPQRKDMVDAIALLESRNGSGISCILLDADATEAASFTQYVSDRYKVDGIASLGNRVTGRPSDSGPIMAFMIGAQKDVLSREIVEVTSVSDNADLWTWTSTVIAERGRMEEVDRASASPTSVARENEEGNAFQAQYVPMSEVGEARSMVPVNQLMPIASMHKWVKSCVDKAGYASVDDFVEASTGLDIRSGKVSPEQIDMVATALTIFEKPRSEGNAILNADGTGLGKTRENLMIIQAAALQGKFATYMTEVDAHFSDMYGEMMELGIQDNFSIMTFNDAPILKDRLTGEVIIPATPRHIVNGLTSRMHYPDGTRMSCYIVAPKEIKRLTALRKALEGMSAPSDEDVATLSKLQKLEGIRSRAQFTTLGEEDFMEMGGDLVDAASIRETHHEVPSYNFFLATYSQINRPTVKTQESKAEEHEAKGKKRKSIYRHDKTEYFVEVLAKRGDRSVLVLDEAHNAADSSSNTFANAGAYIDTADWLVYASATWAKTVKSMRNYHRLFSKMITIDSLSQVIAKGDDGVQETFARMMASESYVRRELSMSDCKHDIYTSDRHLPKQIAVIDAVNSVRSAIAVLAGDIEARVALLNAMLSADKSISQIIAGMGRENIGSEKRFTMTGSIAARRMADEVVRSVLTMDDMADASIALLESGVKPYIVIDGTHERYIKEFHEKHGRIPTLQDVLRRSVTATTSVKDGKKYVDLTEDSSPYDLTDDLADIFIASLPDALRSPEFDEDMDTAERNQIMEAKIAEVKEYFEQNGITDFLDARMRLLTAASIELQSRPDTNPSGFAQAYNNVYSRLIYDDVDRVDLQLSFIASLRERLPRNPAKVSRAIHKMIDDVPDLPISTLDFVKDRIVEAGYTCGEITGRTQCIVNGRLVTRADIEDTDKRAVVDAFNTLPMEANDRSYDAVVGNGASSTSLSMHNKKAQNEEESSRLDKRPRGHVSDAGLGDIAKTMQSLGRIHRNGQETAPVFCSVQPQTPAGIRAVAKMERKLRGLNSLTTSNRESAFTSHSAPDIENKVGDVICFRYLHEKAALAEKLGLKDAISTSEKFDDNGILSATSSISASRVLRAVETFLPFEEQIKVVRDLECEYAAHIEELDALGANPLRIQTLRGVCKVVSKTLISGYESGNDRQSAFTKPVYLAKMEAVSKTTPMLSGKIISLCEASQKEVSETQDERALFLWNHRDSILSEFKGDVSVSADDYINRKDGLVPSVPFVSRYNRLKELVGALRACRVGSTCVSEFGDNFFPDDGCIVGLEMPKRSDNAETAHSYTVKIAYPDLEEPRSIRLSTLIHVASSLGQGVLLGGGSGMRSGSLPDEVLSNFGIYPESGLNSDDPERWITQYDNAARRLGRKTTHVYDILVGNELTALSTAIECNCGHIANFSIEKTNASGEPEIVTDRGVLVTNLKRLMDRPIHVETPEMALAVLDNLKWIGFTIGGSTGTLTIDSKENYRMSFPTRNAKTSSFYENEMFLDCMESIIGKDALEAKLHEIKVSRKKFGFVLEDASDVRAILRVMFTSGYTCATKKEDRDAVARIRQSLYGDINEGLENVINERLEAGMESENDTIDNAQVSDAPVENAPAEDSSNSQASPSGRGIVLDF